MKRIIQFCVLVLACLLLLSSCSFKTKVTVENVGIPREQLEIKESPNSIDTKSKAFKSFLGYVKEKLENSFLADESDFLKVSSNDTGVVIEVSNEKYNQFVVLLADKENSKYYANWIELRDSFANISHQISEIGHEKYNKNCDATIFLLNSFDMNKVLLYIYNGRIEYDVLNDIGTNYVSSQPSYDNGSHSNSGSDNNNNSNPSASSASSGERNALSCAVEYLMSSAFSYDGLIDQLEFEGYSHSEAKYAVDNCGADWYEQALKKAKQYLEYTAFSYTGLVEQLEYEGFTNSESKYATDNCGADWNEQAVKKAKQYLEYSSFSKDSLIEQLEYEGFSSAQAKYGADKAY